MYCVLLKLVKEKEMRLVELFADYALRWKQCSKTTCVVVSKSSQEGKQLLEQKGLLNCWQLVLLMGIKLRTQSNPRRVALCRYATFLEERVLTR